MADATVLTLRSVARRVLAPARRLKSGLRGQRTTGPFHGWLDGLTDDGMIEGWVYDRRTGKGHVAVGLYAGDKLLEGVYAAVSREDVRQANGCAANCGFRFQMTDTIFAQITQADGHVSVRTMGQDAVVIGTTDIVVDTSDPAPARGDVEACAVMLKDDLEALMALLAEVPEDAISAADTPPAIIQPPFAPHARMFSTAPTIPEVPHSGHPAYLDYVRYRYRMDESFKVAPGLESADRYLYWYLTSYRSREKHRVPLSADLLEHLNAPLVMGGQQFALSRIIWWRMSGRSDMMTSVNLNDRDSYLDTLFWWAHQDAPHMYFEDCLVPDRFADLLRGVHPSRRLDAWPLSYFTERFFKDTPSLHFLKPGTAEGRKTLVLAMLVRAATRPDLLRYIPRSALSALLAPGDDGVSDFERFVNDMRAALPAAEDGDTATAPAHVALSRTRYTMALRRKDFDLESFRFMTRDADGNRFEAAAMPPVSPEGSSKMVSPQGGKVDVQLIGPLAKASGLGQATRLSAAILRTTGLNIRGVDFDLDNPAPEGFSSDTLIEDYGPAQINMIHLNAESIPLAYAYQPDVFSGAYNIGYFFWELDKPAWCHYLGMELLDEIWVSTNYGVEIYGKDSGGTPVINVGMCYEETPDITREDSRAFVERRFMLDQRHFICLVAFDSFSFVQRKNPVSVLKAFQQAFEGVRDARLIVKTQNRDSVFDRVQVDMWDQVDTIIASDPRIVVMNETLSYRDLLRLKAGSDCYISLHKSEGWGFGMIEAMNLRVPVVCTAYSGNMDFCNDDTAWLVDFEETPLRQEEYIFVRRGSKWAEPDVADAARQLRAVHDDPAAREAKARAAQDYIRANFSKEAIAERYGARLREILKGLPA